MHTSLFAIASLFSALVVAGCIDTTPMSVEEMNAQLGSGPTDGPFCATDHLATFPPETLRIHVIDVGQGDAIWVQSPWEIDEESESLDVLIDTGGSGDNPGTSPGGAIVVDYMLRHGVEYGDKLDALVITHAHTDHYGGLPAIANAFLIGRYVDPGTSAGSADFITTRTKALESVQSGGGDIDSPAGEMLADRFSNTDLFGNRVTAQLLWATGDEPQGDSESLSNTDVNNTSVVLAIQWPPLGSALSRQVLLMGDLEAAGEAQLLLDAASASHSLSAHILKAGHHGSNTSSTAGFLAQVFPVPDDENRWAVFSSGRQTFGSVTLPSAEIVERIGELLAPYHVLSTANRDEDKSAGEEHDDDHVVFSITAEGEVRGCYVP